MALSKIELAWVEGNQVDGEKTNISPKLEAEAAA